MCLDDYSVILKYEREEHQTLAEHQNLSTYSVLYICSKQHLNRSKTKIKSIGRYFNIYKHVMQNNFQLCDQAYKATNACES